MANFPGHGLTNLGATAASTGLMDGPVPGNPIKTIFYSGTGTSQNVVLAAGNYRTTGGSSFTRASFDTSGQALTLAPLSSALYGVVTNQGGVLFTTTT